MQIAKRYFNISGPNNVEEHYTLMRPDLVKEAEETINGVFIKTRIVMYDEDKAF